MTFVAGALVVGGLPVLARDDIPGPILTSVDNFPSSTAVVVSNFPAVQKITLPDNSLLGVVPYYDHKYYDIATVLGPGTSTVPRDTMVSNAPGIDNPHPVTIVGPKLTNDIPAFVPEYYKHPAYISNTQDGRVVTASQDANHTVSPVDYVSTLDAKAPSWT